MDAEPSHGHSFLAENGGKIVAASICGFAALACFIAMTEMLGAPSATVSLAAVATVAAMLAIMGWSARTSDPGGFFTAGAGLSPLVNALAGIAGWVAVPAFAGLSGLQFAFGYDGLAFLLGPLAGLVLAGIVISPYLAASGTATVPAFLGARFGRMVRVLSALVIAGVVLVVFAAALSLAVNMTAHAYNVPLAYAAGGAALMLAVSLLPGGMNSLSWTGAVAALVLLLVIVGTGMVLSVAVVGHAVTPLAAADAVQAVSDLEIGMIEKGLADAALMKPHAKPFLQIDSANFFGIAFSLMIATATLPMLLNRSLTAPSAGAARSSAAWLIGLMLVIGLSSSAWAVFAKRDVYSMIEKGTSWAALPDWMGSLSRDGGVRIHGVSVALFEDVGVVVRAGAANSSQVAGALADESLQSVAQWNVLKEPVRAALIEAAKALPTGAAPDAAWQTVRDKLLPVAAASANNKTGFVTLAAVKFEPAPLMLSVPLIMGLPSVFSAFVTVAMIAASLAVAGAALFQGASVLAHDVFGTSRAGAPTSTLVLAVRLLMLGLGTAGAALALVDGIDWAALSAIAMAAGAGALFVPLAAGIWWQRTNATGAILAMVSGLLIALVCAGGMRYAPAALFDVWPAASNAGPAALKKFAALNAALQSATGDTAIAAKAALDELAGGTSYKPGLANWWGLGGACALVFAVPVSLLLLVVGSFLGPRPSQSQREFVDLIRRPQSAARGVLKI